jgi:hypothetical protein
VLTVRESRRGMRLGRRTYSLRRDARRSFTVRLSRSVRTGQRVRIDVGAGLAVVRRIAR